MRIDILIELGNIPKHGSPSQNEQEGARPAASPMELYIKFEKTKSK